MRARRDQVRAYRFVTRRLVAAMLSGDPESSEQPLRRLFLAGVAGLMVATIVFAAVGVWGLTHPGGARAWKREMTIVIERESGARYVYTEGVLYPVVNYASARLIVNAANPRHVTASRASLSMTPRAHSLGIAGAPDALPGTRDLKNPMWSVCSALDGSEPTTRLIVGELPVGGEKLGGEGVKLGGEGVVVTGGSTTYLLLGGRRLRVPDKTALIALDLLGAAPSPVGGALIDAVTAGPDLTAPPIPDTGKAGRQIGNKPSRIGEVYRSGGKHYVMLANGLVPIGDVTSKLLTADGRQLIDVSAADVAAVLLEETIEPPTLPRTSPTIRALDGNRAAICVTYRGDIEEPTQVAVYPRAPELLTRSARVLVPGGRGALVQASPAPGVAATGTVYLVTDQGLKYPLVDSARMALGYGEVPVTAVPAAFLALVPAGPVLDPADARRPVLDPATGRPASDARLVR